MAKEHKAVTRGGLQLEEWLRILLTQIARYRELDSVSLDGWRVRAARMIDTDKYEYCGHWKPIAEGDNWGMPDGTFFFANRFRIPKSFEKKMCFFEWVTSVEMIVTVDGKIIDGIDPNRSRVLLSKSARAGKAVDMRLEAYVRSAPDDQRVVGDLHWGCSQSFTLPRLICPDSLVESFLYDCSLPYEVMVCEQVEPDVRAYIRHHLYESLKMVDRHAETRQALHRSICKATAYLRRNVYQARNLAATGAVAAIGHSHLDIAYHWQIRQGIRKNARTTAVQLALMDQYPEFTYCHSQPYLYEKLKDHYPDLYARVKRKVRSGQWELLGGMYVEPDCNLPSAESMIRQCLHGQRFYRKEFGQEVQNCWLLDVFGLSWVLPQILKGSGIKYVFPAKFALWSDTNPFPLNNFIWCGIDGTEVFASVPSGHFISWLAPGQIVGNWAAFKDKEALGESMLLYGFGDGGGGVTREMLETSRRAGRFPGLPRLRSLKAAEYFQQTFRKPKCLKTWNDELYFEMHRGTYTSKAELKKLNRTCELAARQAELFTVFAAASGAPEQTDALRRAWRRVLVNQFHDIIPGSHSSPVTVKAVEDYNQSLAEFNSIRDIALKKIAAKVKTSENPGQPLIVFNSLGWSHTGLVSTDIRGRGNYHILDSDGQQLPSQIISTGDGRKLVFLATDIPSCGYAVCHVRPGKSSTNNHIKVSARRLENRYFRIRLNPNGEITELLDKENDRQVIAAGRRANEFQLFEDKPGVYDAWNLSPFYKDNPLAMPPAHKVRVVEAGPVRAGVRIERRFGASSLTQTIWIYDALRRIDFETAIDWNEKGRLLKVAFPVNVFARSATYDLSYGSIQRPTHETTSWDRAKSEVCGHKWVDLSEHGYGVSLLNNGRYGHDVRNNTIRLSLLRGPIRPDPSGDCGLHEFTYSLYPHAGNWQDAATFRSGYEINSPLLALPVKRHNGPTPSRHSFISINGQHHGAHIGAVKPHEDAAGFVLRLAEQHGGRAQITVQLDRRLSSIYQCDLLERPQRRLPAAAAIKLKLRPFEIRSFICG